MPDFPDLSHWLPPLGPETRGPLPGFVLRHPGEADIAALGERWMDWRETRDAFPGRAAFTHFAATSWLAESEADHRPLGFILGFPSPTRPAEAVVAAIVVAPDQRRKGLGRALVSAFEEQVRAGGATLATATARPDDRPLLGFFRAVGYAPLAGPGTRPLYGIPAFPDHDGPGEDRAVLEHRLG